jgi:hypothetical protein
MMPQPGRVDAIFHQCLRDALAAIPATQHTDPELPVFRDMFVAAAEIAEPSHLVPDRPLEHGHCGHLIKFADCGGIRILQSPEEIVRVERLNRRVNDIVAVCLGDEGSYLEVDRIELVVGVETADVPAPGGADSEVAVVTREVRFSTV